MLLKLTAALWVVTASLWLAVHLGPTPPAAVERRPFLPRPQGAR